jgi:DNA-binding response OmpR family regulator
MKPLIFAVEDDPAQAGLLRDTLEAKGFTVQVFATADAMLSFAPHRLPCLFLLALELPDMNGLDLCREIRQSPLWSQVPIIFVSGNTSVAGMVAGLELADDYICKPFGPQELVARVYAVLRRYEKRHLSAQLAVGDLELNEALGTVVVRGRDVSMTALEFRLLAFLLKNIGTVFSREQLLEAVWNTQFVTTRTVDVYMLRLRKKIELEPDSPCYFQTLRGRGYRLIPPLQCETVLRDAANPLGPQAVPQYPQAAA